MNKRAESITQTALVSTEIVSFFYKHKHKDAVVISIIHTGTLTWCSEDKMKDIHTVYDG